MGGVGAGASPTCYRPLAPRRCLPHAAGTGQRPTAQWAHMLVSAVREPSCVGRLPLRLLLRSDLRGRGAPAGGERGERAGVERRGRWGAWEV